MSSIYHTIVGAIKRKDFTSANEAIGAVLHRKMSERIMEERQRVSAAVLCEANVFAEILKVFKGIDAADLTHAEKWIIKYAQDGRMLRIKQTLSTIDANDLTTAEKKIKALTGAKSLDESNEPPANWDKGFDDGWRPGTDETPIQKNGKWYLWVYNSRTGKKAYYSYSDDQYLDHDPMNEDAQKRCAICRCPATTTKFGFAVCDFHETHGEDGPPCPVCGIDPQTGRSVKEDYNPAREGESAAKLDNAIRAALKRGDTDAAKELVKRQNDNGNDVKLSDYTKSESRLVETTMPTAEVQRVYDETGDVKETELLCGICHLKVTSAGEVLSFVAEATSHLDTCPACKGNGWRNGVKMSSICTKCAGAGKVHIFEGASDAELDKLGDKLAALDKQLSAAKLAKDWVETHRLQDLIDYFQDHADRMIREDKNSLEKRRDGNTQPKKGIAGKSGLRPVVQRPTHSWAERQKQQRIVRESDDPKLPHYAHSIACDVNREDDEDWSKPVRCTCGAQARWDKDTDRLKKAKNLKEATKKDDDDRCELCNKKNPTIYAAGRDSSHFVCRKCAGTPVSKGGLGMSKSELK